jgi:hypothetical protein
MFDCRGTAVGSPNHGGLTPAALVNVRLCTAKIVVIPADGRCNTAKSGGRKPPVVSQTRLQVRFQHITDYVPPATPTAGSRPPLLVAHSPAAG